MEKVAFIYNGEYIYWRPVFLLLGVVAGALMALALGIGKKRLIQTLLALPLSLAASLYAARFIHWYCRSGSYESFHAAMTKLTPDGAYSLIGVFVGTAAVCALLRLVRVTRDLPGLLDIAAPALALGIAVGRLGDYFSAADRGRMLIENPAFHRLPFAAAVLNPTSGAEEWRLATFALQSAWAAAIFLALILCTLLPLRRKRGGTVAELFLALYCMGQIVLDSTRYDALFLRSNGFVSLEQIVCAVVLVGLTALYSVRSIRAGGFRLAHALLWALTLGGLGLAGYMEYYVQRHGNAWVTAYGVMCVGLLLWACAAVALRGMKRPLAAAEEPGVVTEQS